MSVLNLSCPICKIVFKNTDAVYSTSCGHIFHFNCLNDWKCRSTTCPQCRDYNPTSHRIYLNFDEEFENSSSMTSLKTQIDSSNAKIAALEKDLEDKKIQFQKLRCDGEKSRKDYKNQYQELSTLITNLRIENQTLKNSIKDAAQKLEKEILTVQELSQENSELKMNLESTEVGSYETILREKNKVLEQKLKHISTEFEKEISNSTQLSIDKMKLQSYVERMQLEENLVARATKPMSRKPNTPGIAKKHSQPKKKHIFDPVHTVVIHKFPSNRIKQPLENIIISIAEAMDLLMTKEDITKVVVNHNKLPSAAVQLFVEFKTIDWKLKFISGKDMLKDNPATQFIDVEEYSNENIRSLFEYTNTKLRGKVFGYIAVKSNSIIAKRNLLDIDEIEITSRSQVDDLLTQHQLLRTHIHI